MENSLTTTQLTLLFHVRFYQEKHNNCMIQKSIPVNSKTERKLRSLHTCYTEISISCVDPVFPLLH